MPSFGANRLGNSEAMSLLSGGGGEQNKKNDEKNHAKISMARKDLYEALLRITAPLDRGEVSF
jgi:hypothetical protein